jgi:outer membrane lipoprotein-sorting protein
MTTTRFKSALAALVLYAPIAWADPAPMAQKLALAAFKSPSTPFQAKLMLTEWRNGESRAEEARLFFSPPNSYRIEFLSFDGAVKRIIVSDEKNSRVFSPSLEGPSFSNSLLQTPALLTPEKTAELLLANYNFVLKGSEMFIGRPVWVLQLVPRVPGKPLHELRIDQETLVVLEQRRYVSKDKIGSLTRFSDFEPNKELSAELFTMDSSDDGILEKKNDDAIPPVFSVAPPPQESYRLLPAGFSLQEVRSFEVEGTTANHFTYTDGALPLSVFETKLPVRFPEKKYASDKMDLVANPTNGFSSSDQVVYGKKGQNYFTIVGEVSPDLLQMIAEHFN